MSQMVTTLKAPPGLHLVGCGHTVYRVRARWGRARLVGTEPREDATVRRLDPSVLAGDTPESALLRLVAMYQAATG